MHAQKEAANGSAEPHKHSSSSSKHKEHKHQDKAKGAAPEPAEPQGKPWLAEHILVKIIDKRLQDGRCAACCSPHSSVLATPLHRGAWERPPEIPVLIASEARSPYAVAGRVVLLHCDRNEQHMLLYVRLDADSCATKVLSQRASQGLRQD